MRTEFTPAQLNDPQIAESAAEVRKCVHCGFCNGTCPTYVLLGDELDSPRGRIYLIKEMLENERQPTEPVVRHIDRCLSCLSCVTTCPSDVNYMRLIDHARAYVEARYLRPLPDRWLRTLLAQTLPFPRRLRAALALARLARPLRGLLPARPPFASLIALLDLAPSRPHRGARVEGAQALGRRRGRVALMVSCVEPALRPEIPAAATRLLSRAGFEVVLAAGQGCCGALTHHMGGERDSLAAARRNVDAWSAEIEARGLDAIVVTASGCGSSVKDYGHLLRTDLAYAEKAARVAALAKDITELLDGNLPPPTGRAPSLIVGLHAACSLQHGQAIREQPTRLLTAAGFRVCAPREGHLCCGSAGVYNILQPAIARRLGQRKAQNLDRLDADVLATGNIGCATQIAAYAAKPVVHIVELLDWATGGPVPPRLASRHPPDACR